MNLLEYRRKRDFGQTTEPAPGRLPASEPARPIFVVQLHHASHRHYDFRLQIGGVLKSWAVPKGPSLDPRVRRLAVEVEDHPLQYAEFEGTIPAGQYGAGTVVRFDHGIWTVDGNTDAEEQLADGHLKFSLHGAVLRGRWHLIRSSRGGKRKQWLLIKQPDAHASRLEADALLAAQQVQGTRRGRTPVPGGRAATGSQWAKRARALGGDDASVSAREMFAPQLAESQQHPPSDDTWLHEIKWDGYRLLAVIDDGSVRLWSRNGIDWTPRLPEIVRALEALPLRSAKLDGELIAGGGKASDFNLLQAVLSGTAHAGLSYVLFDLLLVDGVDLAGVELAARKRLLARLLSDPPSGLAYSSHIEANGEHVLALAVEHGFEGIISKRADRPYRPGRSREWLKIRYRHSDEYAVVGYTLPKGSRHGFGSLLLAAPDDQRGWRYAGRVGSGFSDPLISEVMTRIGGAGGPDPTVHIPRQQTDLRGARWFRPRFVAEVFFRGKSRDGLLRQPSLKTIRMDKNVDDLKAASRRAVKPGTTTKRRPTQGRRADPRPRPLTNPARIVYPEIRATKQDVADYYRAAARLILPELAGRPVSIVRCPDGISGACFFQKHPTSGMAAIVQAELPEDDGSAGCYLQVVDLDGLMELVQFSAIEFHPWNALTQQSDRTDRVIFDLDPGPGVSWAEVVAAARDVRKILKRVGLDSFVRTTGGKGLHVVAPLRPTLEWAPVRSFAQALARTLAEREPLRFIAKSGKKLRRGRIFVDYLRNGRGATSIASFSLRARRGAPVAMPIRWQELGRLSGGNHYDMASALRRMARLKSHPWRDFDRLAQGLDGVDPGSGKQ